MNTRRKGNGTELMGMPLVRNTSSTTTKRNRKFMQLASRVIALQSKLIEVSVALASQLAGLVAVRLEVGGQSLTICTISSQRVELVALRFQLEKQQSGKGVTTLD